MYTFNLLIYFIASVNPVWCISLIFVHYNLSNPYTCESTEIKFISITLMTHRPVTKHRGLKFEDGFNSKFCAIFENQFLSCRLLRRFAGGVA